MVVHGNRPTSVQQDYTGDIAWSGVTSLETHRQRPLVRFILPRPVLSPWRRLNYNERHTSLESDNMITLQVSVNHRHGVPGEQRCPCTLAVSLFLVIVLEPSRESHKILSVPPE